MRRTTLASLVALSLPLLALTQTPADAGTPAPRTSAPAAHRAAPVTIQIPVKSAKNHPVVGNMGYDLQQLNRAKLFSPAAADILFGKEDGSTRGLGFHLVRIDLNAREAHAKPGLANVNDASYAGTVHAMQVLGKRADKVTVFGSLKSFTDKPDFPDWVTTKKVVNPGPYSTLLLQYLQYWEIEHHVTIDVLGVDNESALNDGKITPAKFVAIVKALNSKIAAWNKDHPGQRLTQPKYTAPDSYGPDYHYLQKLGAAGGWQYVSFAGMHYYSKHRSGGFGCDDGKTCLAQLGQFAQVAHQHQKVVWDSEFHWNESDHDGAPEWPEWKSDLFGIIAAADNFDNRATGMTWWSFNMLCPDATRHPWCDSGVRGQLHTAVAASTAGGRETDFPADGDGTAAQLGHLTTRAFVRGNVVSVWLINDTTAKVSRRITVPGFTMKNGYRAGLQQWNRTSASSGLNLVRRNVSHKDATGGALVMNLPPRSISVLTLPGVTVK